MQVSRPSGGEIPPPRPAVRYFVTTLVEGGRVTAAVSSQISDAAAAMLVVSESALRVHRLTPRARIHHLSVRGADPIYMLTAPIPATAHALARTGMIRRARAKCSSCLRLKLRPQPKGVASVAAQARPRAGATITTRPVGAVTR